MTRINKRIVWIAINLKMCSDKLRSSFKAIGIDDNFSPYNQEYIDMIENAENDIKKGRGRKIAIEDLWK